MTTIALDAKCIAWDSLMILGDSEKMTCLYEKARVDGRTIYAAAGDAKIEELIRWAKDQDGWRPPKGEWELLIITKGVISHATAEAPTPYPVMPPIAIGTGAQYARGAMLAGAGAKQAVEIAAMCDAHTGGEIKSLALGDVFKRRLVVNPKRKAAATKPRSRRCR